jgi:hypothetical protein
MIAITVCTPDYADMAHENAEWFRQNSGLDVMVVTVSGDGFAAKLEIPRFYKGRGIFFDADYRLIRKVDVSKVIATTDMHGVVEPCAKYGGVGCFPYDDCLITGMKPRQYWNTGLFSFDTSRADQVETFHAARQMLEEKRNGAIRGISDTTEQSIFNLAMIQRGLPRVALPPEWNFYTMSYQRGWLKKWPREPIGIHAAGVVGAHHKRTHLNELHAILSRS